VTRNRSWRGTAADIPAPVTAAALLVAAVTVLPLLVIVVRAADVGWSASAALLWRPRVGELLRNTVVLVALTVSATAVIGIGAAWLVERTQLPGARIWRVLLVSPLAVPAFVNSYAWISLRPGMHGLGGAVLVTTLSYFPFVFLPVAAVLRGLDGSLEDAARSLGLGPWRVFARTVLPQLRPAALGGALLVGLHLLAEFGVLSMMRFPTFTTAILEQFQVAFSNASGSLLACVLIALCLGLLTAETLLRGNVRHARSGRGTRRRPAPIALGRWQPLALAALTTLSGLALAVPVTALIRWLGVEGADVAAVEVLSTMGTTFALATAAAAATTLAAFPVAWLLARKRSLLTHGIERITYVASSLPGVVIALALVTLVVPYAPAIYQTTALLVVAYLMLFLPRAMVSIRSAMAHAPPELIEAARALGQGPLRAFWRVLLPLTLPGVLAGFAMVFIAVSTELTATLLLSPTGTRTLATEFWSASESLDYAAAAPFALAMILLSVPLAALLLHRAAEETT
jgi:iron(III) transport system permease protein